MVKSTPVAPASTGRRTAAFIFAVFGLAALAVSAWFGYQRYQREHPKPLPNVIAPIPADQFVAIRTGLNIVGKTVLQVTPDQEKQLAEVWKHPPRSLEEVIQYQKRTDQILTETQRARFRPIRKKAQSAIIDKMLAPAADRMPPGEFTKLTDQVKDRVNHRIDKP